MRASASVLCVRGHSTQRFLSPVACVFAAWCAPDVDVGYLVGFVDLAR